ncbi:hypothetical protein C9Z31_18320, partial [Escherichia coli]
NINAGHEITSKARIIHQIQLIRGITHQVLRENQTRPCREANHYSGRHHNTPILIPCLQRHFYRVTDCAVIINKSPGHLASRRISR